MKIKKPKLKLIELKLLEISILNDKENINYNIELTDIVTRLKKSLQIIYKYHTLHKKILFIGPSYEPPNPLKRLLKSTKHVFFPASLWVRGAIIDRVFYLHYLFKNRNEFSLKMKKLHKKLDTKFDLVVILDKKNNTEIINEYLKAKVPLIIMGNLLNPHQRFYDYKILGNFQMLQKKEHSAFFYQLLFSTLKKGNRIKKQKTKIKNDYKKNKKI
jgi:ribosomal protein S2